MQNPLPPTTFQTARTKKGWYSQYNKTGEREVEVLLDKEGRPTTGYPHVHVIHDEKKGEIRLHNTPSRNVHRNKMVLPGAATGNEVNKAVDHLRSILKRRAHK